MSFPIIGLPKPQFFDSSGSPLSSGTLSVLDPADDTNKAYYPTADDADALTNASSGDITLDSRGETPNALFGIDGEDYKLVLKDSLGTTIWTVDDIRVPQYTAPATSHTVGVGVGSIIAKTQQVVREVGTQAFTRNATIVEDRTLLASASATTLNNNNVLAALIADLQQKGIIA